MRVHLFPFSLPFLKLSWSNTNCSVIEWDADLHIKATNIWTKSVLADGGEHCKHLCELVNEPLIEGMLVGTPNDELSLPERELVITPRLSLYNQDTNQKKSSLKNKNGTSKPPSSTTGKPPKLTPSSPPSSPGSATGPKPGSTAPSGWATRPCGIC